LRRALSFALAAATFSLLIGVVGAAIAGPDGRRAVWIGVGLALGIQLVLASSLFLWLFSGRPLLAHGVGMVARFATVGTVALFWVPWAGLPAAPLLFSLVTVFFLTTLLEPLFLFSLSTAR